MVNYISVEDVLIHSALKVLLKNMFGYEGGVYPLRISEQPEETIHVAVSYTHLTLPTILRV